MSITIDFDSYEGPEVSIEVSTIIATGPRIATREIKIFVKGELLYKGFIAEKDIQALKRFL